MPKAPDAIITPRNRRHPKQYALCISKHKMSTQPRLMNSSEGLKNDRVFFVGTDFTESLKSKLRN